MKTQFYIITKLLDIDYGIIQDVVWKHAMTHDDKKVTFWGEPQSMRNILSIEKQQVPFIVEILGAEENLKHKRKYGTDISVNEGCFVTVYPLAAQMIRSVKPDSLDKLLKQISDMVLAMRSPSTTDSKTPE